MINGDDIRYTLATSLLASGRYAQGWKQYEARSESSWTGIRKPALPIPEWTGQDLRGKHLLVWPEQGLGDKIMFARFIQQIEAGAVSVLCEPALTRLFSSNLKADVITASGEVNLPDADYWVFYGSLPFRLGVAAPRGDPYMFSHGRSAARPGITIGVCATGSPQHPNNARRSITGADAARLAGLPGAMSLLPEDTRAADFAETARIIDGLDLVVTVDTAVAHLAGAMGKPTWILLPSAGIDWRWGLKGKRTPWYPSARLYRQAPGEPWSAVIARVAGSLARR